MGFLSDIFGFIDNLSGGGSYYKDSSIEWCDKAWRRLRYTERGEGRLVRIGDNVYHQLYVVLEDDMEGYISDSSDRGCNIDNIKLSKETRKELDTVGHIVIKRYK